MNMVKILEPADKALSAIGRFVLLRPAFSSFLLLLAVLLTLWHNGIFSGSSLKPVLAEASTMTSLPLNIEEGEQLSAYEGTFHGEEIKLALLETPAGPAPEWHVLQITPGDTLSGIFKRYDIRVAEALKVSKIKEAKPLKKLKLGQEMRLLVNPDNTLNELVYGINKTRTLTIKKTDDGFDINQANMPISQMAYDIQSGIAAEASSPLSIAQPTEEVVSETITAKRKKSSSEAKALAAKTREALLSAEKTNEGSIIYVSGEITHSLYVDAKKAGLTTKQAYLLGEIFSVKDLTRRLRKGDQFSILYEKPPTDSDAEGNILLAQLNHRGQDYQAIRFTDPNGKTAYYNPEGRSLQPSISRTPVKYSRISSNFSRNRMHPVLKIKRPHLGVDYAAPKGTPIKAAGDGVVAYRGYKGGYGNTVTIKHDSKYTTLYAHMSRFNSKVKKGTVVKEGQTIGYVGKTGLASGPHLHYEIKVNNRAQNPRTVALPGTSVPTAYKNLFLSEAKVLLSQLQLNQAIQLATKDGNDPSAAS